MTNKSAGQEINVEFGLHEWVVLRFFEEIQTRMPSLISPSTGLFTVEWTFNGCSKYTDLAAHKAHVFMGFCHLDLHFEASKELGK